MEQLSKQLNVNNAAISSFELPVFDFMSDRVIVVFIVIGTLGEQRKICLGESFGRRAEGLVHHNKTSNHWLKYEAGLHLFFSSHIFKDFANFGGIVVVDDRAESATGIHFIDADHIYLEIGIRFLVYCIPSKNNGS